MTINVLRTSQLMKIELLFESEFRGDLKLYNTSGQLVDVLYSGSFTNNKKLVEYNSSKLPTGVYFLNLSTNSLNETKKIFITK